MLPYQMASDCNWTIPLLHEEVGIALQHPVQYSNMLCIFMVNRYKRLAMQNSVCALQLAYLFASAAGNVNATLFVCMVD